MRLKCYFHHRVNWGLEKLGNWPKVTQMVSGCTMTQSMPVLFPGVLVTYKFCCLLGYNMVSNRGQLINVSFLPSCPPFSVCSFPVYAKRLAASELHHASMLSFLLHSELLSTFSRHLQPLCCCLPVLFAYLVFWNKSLKGLAAFVCYQVPG